PRNIAGLDVFEVKARPHPSGGAGPCRRTAHGGRGIILVAQSGEQVVLFVFGAECWALGAGAGACGSGLGGEVLRRRVGTDRGIVLVAAVLVSIVAVLAVGRCKRPRPSGGGSHGGAEGDAFGRADGGLVVGIGEIRRRRRSALFGLLLGAQRGVRGAGGAAFV